MLKINHKERDMRASELIELLKEHPDFDVTTALFEPDGSEWGMGLRTFVVTGISDIGHSGKVIQLDLEEKD
jgi:hypothetical protein